MQVTITNRQDCCSERISGAKIYIGDIYCDVVNYTPGINSYTFNCNAIVGSRVRIVNDKTDLTLCEVAVYGDAAGNR